MQIDPDDLPTISEEEYAFVLRIVRGDQVIQAYEATHPTDHIPPSLIKNKAYNLSKSPRIKEWKATILSEVRRKLGVTHQDYNQHLLDLIECARAKDQWGAVTGLMTTLGKSMGFLSQRVILEDKRDTLKDNLSKLEKLSPELAQQWRDKLMITHQQD